MWQGWINFLAGIWLIVSGFVYPLEGRANVIIVGVILIIFGFWDAPWQGIINGLLGIWLLVCGIVLPHLAYARWNYFWVGIVVLILGAWRGSMTRRAAPPAV